MIGSLVAARLRHRFGAVALIVAGLVCAIAGLVGARVAVLHARDEALRASIAALGPGGRTVRVGVFEATRAGNGVPGFIPAPGAGPAPAARDRSDPGLPRLGFQRRVSLGVLTGGGASAGGGTPVTLAGLDDPGRWLADRSGRLPERCRPTHCEAVYVGGAGLDATSLTVRDVRPVIVG